jgi:hypothetical protein
MASLIFGQLQTPQKGSVSSLKQRSGSLLDHVKSPQLRSIAAGLLNDKQKKKKRGGGRRKGASRRGGSVQTITMDQFTKLNQDAWRRSPSSSIYGRKIKLSKFTSTSALSRFNESSLEAQGSLYRRKPTPKKNPVKAAYRISNSKKKSFVRAEQQHEKLVRPWGKEHLRSSKESKSVSKARGTFLSAKTVDFLRRTGRGHLYNILDEANALVYAQTKRFKVATQGNRFVQDLVDGVDQDHASQPAVMFDRINNLVFEDKATEKLGSPAELVAQTSGPVTEDDPNNLTFIQNESECDGIEIEDGQELNLVVGVAQVDLENNGLSDFDDSGENDVPKNGFSDDDGLEFSADAPLQVQTQGSGERPAMAFDEETMRWNPVGEVAKKEEEDMMAAFDEESDDDDGGGWG